MENSEANSVFQILISIILLTATRRKRKLKGIDANEVQPPITSLFPILKVKELRRYKTLKL